MQKNKTQFGRSMVEMLAVLTIIGVVSIGGTAGYKQAITKYRISKTHTDIQAINSDVVNLFSWQRGYPDSETQEDFEKLLCENNVFPDGCEEDKASNPFGGEYKVTTDPDTQTMTIEATKIPTSACEDLEEKTKTWNYVKSKSCVGDGEDKTFSVTFE